MNRNIGETSDKNSQMVDYMLHSSSTADHEEEHQFANETSLDDKLNYFQDVMQFADFGPRLNQNQDQDKEAANKMNHEETTNNGIDDPNIFFLKFPVLNDHLHDQEEHEHDHLMMFGGGGGGGSTGNREGDEARGVVLSENDGKMNGLIIMSSSEREREREREGEREGEGEVKINNNNKKKRGRSIKTSEEVESQRMTHIAVERNRRKQMNEHLRVLRSLMPTSYVQRGDQASIIGGAIEFVRELEQLLQCLESQKRRRLYGDNCPPTTVVGGANSAAAPLVVVDQDQQQPPPHQPPFFPAAMMQPPPVPPLNINNDHHNQMLLLNMHETSQEEIAESKSCIADIEVKLLGFDAMIKILSRRRPGQLVKTIAALEDLQINILHTNITTIDQTVLYSFTVKVGGEARLTAEDIANSVQQIFTFIHAYDSI